MCPIENAQALLNNFCGLAVHANSGQGRNGRGGLGGRGRGAAPEDTLEILKPQPPLNNSMRNGQNGGRGRGHAVKRHGLV